jgi:tripartite-type tricarboxylate transporter receptor subunit TctC
MRADRQRFRRTRRAVSAALLLAPALHARAAGRYPQRPVTLIVPFAAGGIADLTARTVAEAMAKTLGQPLVIDNRPSAGTIVGSAAVAQARPDGHMLLLLSNGNAVSASLFRKLPFDVTRDFAPVSTLGTFELGLFVGERSPHAALPDLLDHARRSPGRLTIGTIAVGSTQHLAAALFKSTAAVDVLVVPFKSSPELLRALRRGETDLAFEILGPMLPQVSAKAVRALAVTAETRNPALPAVPTVRESGFPDYVVASWNAIAAPAGTPAGVIATLGDAIRQAVSSAAVRERLQALGVRPKAGTPAELQALLAAEIARWRTVIAAARIEPQ